MSETEFEGQQAVDPGGDGYDYEDGGGGAELDPYEPGFGEELGAHVRESVQAGIASFFTPENGQEPAAVDPGQEMPPALTDEDLEHAGQQADAAFNSMAEHVGEFDRQEAFGIASEEFDRLTNAGMPVEEALPQAMATGAEQAALARQGEPIAEQLIAAELGRVGPDVDKSQLRNLADAGVGFLIDQGVPDQQAAAMAIEAAATVLAGGRRWAAPSHPDHNTTQIVRYYAQKAAADHAMSRIGQKPSVPDAEPGRALSPAQLAAKYGRR